ncbi:portal protein [Pelagibacteraceae bacterium]|nr:portal protein [Pelagibacteraceae bacterium]
MTTDIIRQTFKLAKAAREKHEDEISEAYKFTRPNRDIWRHRESTTDRTKIYDSTAPDSVQNLVSTILNLLIPQNQQWATLSVREDVKEEVASDIKRLLDKANRTVFKTIRDSNFYISASEALTDAIISGCGAIGLYETETEIEFIGIPTYQLYFLDDYKGELDTVFRQHQCTAQYLFENFKNLPDEIKEQALKSPNQQIDVTESCMRLTGDKDYTYTVMVGKSLNVIHTKKMATQMFVVFRFGRTIGEVWGESPVRMALPYIRTINECQMLMLQAAAYASLGAWQVNSETAVNFANVKLKAGDVVTVDQPLTPIPFAGNFQITDATIQDHRQQIRRMMFNDVILPPDNSPSMTATEIQIRQSEFYRRLGTYGLRLEQEFLRPIISNVVKRLQIKGSVPQFVTDKNAFEIVVNSAVKRGIALSEITRDMQVLQVITQLGAEASMSVDLTKLARKILRDGDMSPEVLRSDAEIEEMKEQMQQQQQLQQVAQQFLQSQNPNAEPQQ